MLCVDFESLLTDYIEGVVGPETNKLMGEHAMRCPICHETLSAVRSTMQACRTAAVPPPSIELEARILQCGAHAILRFFHLRLRQANDGEVGQAIREVCLDGHERRVHARKGATVEYGQRHERRYHPGIGSEYRINAAEGQAADVSPRRRAPAP